MSYSSVKKIFFLWMVIAACAPLSASDYIPLSTRVLSHQQIKIGTALCGLAGGALATGLCLANESHATEVCSVGVVGLTIGGLSALGTNFFLNQLSQEKQLKELQLLSESMDQDSILKENADTGTLLASIKAAQTTDAIDLAFVRFVANTHSCSPLMLHDQLETIVSHLAYQDKRCLNLGAYGVEQLSSKIKEDKATACCVLTYLKASLYYHRAWQENCQESKIHWKVKLSYLIKLLALLPITAIFINLAGKCGFEIQLPSQIPSITIQLPENLFEQSSK